MVEKVPDMKVIVVSSRLEITKQQNCKLYILTKEIFSKESYISTKTKIKCLFNMKQKSTYSQKNVIYTFQQFIYMEKGDCKMEIRGLKLSQFAHM